jgi:hypothetical protein
MSQELKIAVVIALALGIAFLAFKFSDAYKHLLSYALLGVLWVVFILALVWIGGVLCASRALGGYVEAANAQQSLASIESCKIPLRYLLIIFAVSNLYLWGLRYVYDLLEHLQKQRDAKIISERGY